MDLFLIARKIWRHKLVTVPIIVLTLCGAVYVIAVKGPLYEATASYLLVSPPEPPTTEEIARNPALGRVRADNPYTRFADQTVVVNVLARTMSDDAARRALVRAGADSRYKVEAAVSFGSSNPIVQITGTGATPQTAIRTANVVGEAVTGELDRLQRAQEVDARYRITALRVETPDGAQLQPSGQLRMLVGVLGLGTILLFIAVSVTEGLAAMRRDRVQHAELDRLEGLFDDPWPANLPEPHEEPSPSTGERSARLEGLFDDPWPANPGEPHEEPSPSTGERSA